METEATGRKLDQSPVNEQDREESVEKGKFVLHNIGLIEKLRITSHYVIATEFLGKAKDRYAFPYVNHLVQKAKAK